MLMDRRQYKKMNICPFCDSLSGDGDCKDYPVKGLPTEITLKWIPEDQYWTVKDNIPNVCICAGGSTPEKALERYLDLLRWQGKEEEEKKTHISIDINSLWNIFIESFDGSEYTVCLMNRKTIEMRTVTKLILGAQ